MDESAMLVGGKGTKGSKGARGTLDVSLAWRMAVAGGLVLGVAGWTDVLLLWYPLRFGNPEWEFATTSGMFDALPLGTIGFLVLSAWAVLRQRPAVTVTLGVVGLGIVLALLASAVLFVLSWAQAMGAIGPENRWVLLRAGAKTTLYALLYSGLYLWMTFKLLGAARQTR